MSDENGSPEHPKVRTCSRGYVVGGPIHSGCRLHSLVMIAEGADPNKVYSNGEYHVHHKNGIRWDNRPSNLELLSSFEHMSIHAKQRIEDGRVQPYWQNIDKGRIGFVEKLLMFELLIRRGDVQADIAKYFDTTPQNVSRIKSNELEVEL